MQYTVTAAHNNGKTEVTVTGSKQFTSDYSLNRRTFDGDHTSKTDAQLIELMNRQLDLERNPDGAIQELETRVQTVEDNMPLSYNGNSQVVNLAYEYIANANGKELWPGKYRGQAVFIDEIKPGEYVPGQIFKFKDPTNLERVGEWTLGRVRTDWTGPWTYTGQEIAKGADDYYLVDGVDAYESGLDILRYKARP